MAINQTTKEKEARPLNILHLVGFILAVLSMGLIASIPMLIFLSDISSPELKSGLTIGLTIGFGLSVMFYILFGVEME